MQAKTERYIMSQDQRDALLGEQMRKRKELQSHIAHLQAQAGKWGTVLNSVGNGLSSDPVGLTFGGEAMDGRFMRHDIPNPAEFDAINRQGIQALCRDLRQAEIDLSNVEQAIKNMGYE